MNDENPFRIVLVVVSILQTAVMLPYLRKAGAGSTIFRERAEGVALSVAIGLGYLAYGVAVVVYLVHPGWMAWSAIDAAAWIRWCGVGPLLLGACGIVWALHSIGGNITISIKTKQNHQLITTGPYGWVRHPLYTAGIVETLGVCLLLANWFIALSAGFYWALVAWRTPQEEQRLIEKFGDNYRQYAQRVGRFAPRIAHRILG